MEDGQMAGDVSLDQARYLAEQYGLDLVELNGLGHGIAGCKGFDVIVCRVAAQADIVQEGADGLGVGRLPIEIRGIELNNLISHAGDFLQRVWEIARQFSADGIEFQADGEAL